MGAVNPQRERRAMLWVEVLARGEVVSRHRCIGRSLTIGRGYDCELILDDPHVAARHAQLTLQDDGVLLIEDLGSLNGLHTHHSGPRQRRLHLLPGEPVCVGGTWLRACTESLRVAPEQALRPPLTLWPWLLATTLALAGLSLAERLLLNAYSNEPGDAVAALVRLLLGLLGWAGGWALATRAFSGRARLELHLLLACGALLSLSLLGHVLDVLAYSLSQPVLADGKPALRWVLLGALLIAHLLTISPAHARLKAAAVIGLLLVVAGFSLRDRLDPSVGHPLLLRGLQPPVLRLVQPESAETFFGGAARLQGALDESRTTEQPSRRHPALFDD